ncbi:hypothetical protein [Massilia sp. YIM B04103]|uniref:hypothetical protein n=1 Tax=Massilia sp. YIM B04103 TaxID=2963106 RepID=UPI00210DAC97|nr:hypothetical protein [Massilia sp. YIM B04103]
MRLLELDLGGSNISRDIECEQIGQVEKVESEKQDRPLSAGTTQARNKWNLAHVLAELVNDPALAQSKHVVSVKGEVEAQPFSSFFVHTASLNRRHQGGTKAFWGKIVNANYAQNGALWLNSGISWGGGNDTLEICISQLFNVRTRFLSNSLKFLLAG